MKRLINCDSLFQAGHIKNILQQAGIDCLIKNEQLSGGLGEIPFLDCLPELWILRNKDFERAQSLLKSSCNANISGTPWGCMNCGEKNESHFAVCWKCGIHDSINT